MKVRFGAFLTASYLMFAATGFAQCSPESITLLHGFNCRVDPPIGVPTRSGTIHKKGGLRIEFEEGISQGLAVNSIATKDYGWYREIVIEGHPVKIGLIKLGVKSIWEPALPRDKRIGNILLVSMPLGIGKMHAINFRAEIVSDYELADAIIMILSFKPSTI